MKRPMPYGCRGPSHGRGPNQAYFERLVQHETDRSAWYPNPGVYLEILSRTSDYFKEHPDATLTFIDGRQYDRESWEREKVDAINRRINAKGGQRYSRHNDPGFRGMDIRFYRDSMRLKGYGGFGWQLETAPVQERFGRYVRGHEPERF